MSVHPVISVIIPVYNVEAYIDKCIQSLINQTYTNFEALIIDDGSLDQSIMIARKMVGDDPRFIFIEKENGGVSSARNYGLNYAVGDYIAFLDSDDYIDHQTFQKCITSIEKSKGEIVIFGTQWVTETGKVIKVTHSDLSAYQKKQDVLLTQGSIEPMVWNKLYHRSIFDQLNFKEGIIYEDSAIMYQILYGRNIVCILEPLYSYVQREGSIMRTYNMERTLHSLETIYRDMENFLRVHSLTQYRNDVEKFYINNAWFAELGRMIRVTNVKEYHVLSKQLRKHIGKYKLNWLKINKIYGLCSKQSLGFLLFQISPSLYRIIYKIIGMK